MKTGEDNQELLVRYLLGEVSEEQQHQIEEQFFAEDDCFERMVALEDELIYEYSAGKLGRREREMFEKRFLASDESRRRIETARDVIQALARRNEATLKPQARTEPAPSWWASFAGFFSLKNRLFQFALAGVALVAVTGFVWLMMETTRLRNQVGELQANQTTHEQLREQAERERGRADQLASELERERRSRGEIEQQLAQQRSASQEPEDRQARAIVSMMLGPGLVRGDGGAIKRLVIPIGASLVRIQLEVKQPAGYRIYSAALLTAAGKQVWKQAGLRTQKAGAQQSITITFPARLVTDGDYEIALAGLTADKNVEELASYYFTVKK